MKKNIISLIPARSGSKSIKDKNIKLFKGKPLIYWSIKASKDCKLINKTIVTTDSEKYKKIAYDSGADIVLKRPKKISLDNSTDLQFVKHAINNLDFDFEFIVHLRPTTPLRDQKYLNMAIKKFINSKYTSLRCVHENSETAYKSFEIKKKKLVTIFKKKSNIDLSNLPRQKYPTTYVANGLADIYKKSHIIKNDKLFGNKVLAYITNPTIEIDSISEYNLLNKIK